MANETAMTDDASVPSRALFFELEYLATSGRAFLYEAVNAILAEKKVAVSPPLFSQYFTMNTVAKGLKQMERVTGRSGLATASVENKIRAAFVESIKSDNHKNKGLIALTSDLRQHGIELGALTCLDDEYVNILLEKLGLGRDDVQVMKADNHDKNCPTAQDWLTLAKQMQTSTALCTVAATSAISCRAALCAGMRCFAVPDAFTDFQDFSGTDYVIDSLDIDAEKLVLKLVEAF